MNMVSQRRVEHSLVEEINLARKYKEERTSLLKEEFHPEKYPDEQRIASAASNPEVVLLLDTTNFLPSSNPPQTDFYGATKEALTEEDVEMEDQTEEASQQLDPKYSSINDDQAAGAGQTQKKKKRKKNKKNKKKGGAAAAVTCDEQQQNERPLEIEAIELEEDKEHLQPQEVSTKVNNYLGEKNATPLSSEGRISIEVPQYVKDELESVRKLELEIGEAIEQYESTQFLTNEIATSLIQQTIETIRQEEDTIIALEHIKESEKEAPVEEKKTASKKGGKKNKKGGKQSEASTVQNEPQKPKLSKRQLKLAKAAAKKASLNEKKAADEARMKLLAEMEHVQSQLEEKSDDGEAQSEEEEEEQEVKNVLNGVNLKILDQQNDEEEKKSVGEEGQSTPEKNTTGKKKSVVFRMVATTPRQPSLMINSGRGGAGYHSSSADDIEDIVKIPKRGSSRGSSCTEEAIHQSTINMLGDLFPQQQKNPSDDTKLRISKITTSSSAASQSGSNPTSPADLAQGVTLAQVSKKGGSQHAPPQITSKFTEEPYPHHVGEQMVNQNKRKTHKMSRPHKSPKLSTDKSLEKAASNFESYEAMFQVAYQAASSSLNMPAAETAEEAKVTVNDMKHKTGNESLSDSQLPSSIIEEVPRPTSSPAPTSNPLQSQTLVQSKNKKKQQRHLAQADALGSGLPTIKEMKERGAIARPSDIQSAAIQASTTATATKNKHQNKKEKKAAQLHAAAAAAAATQGDLLIPANVAMNIMRTQTPIVPQTDGLIQVPQAASQQKNGGTQQPNAKGNKLGQPKGPGGAKGQQNPNNPKRKNQQSQQKGGHSFQQPVGQPMFDPILQQQTFDQQQQQFNLQQQAAFFAQNQQFLQHNAMFNAFYGLPQASPAPQNNLFIPPAQTAQNQFPNVANPTNLNQFQQALLQNISNNTYFLNPQQELTKYHATSFQTPTVPLQGNSLLGGSGQAFIDQSSLFQSPVDQNIFAQMALSNQISVAQQQLQEKSICQQTQTDESRIDEQPENALGQQNPIQGQQPFEMNYYQNINVSVHMPQGTSHASGQNNVTLNQNPVFQNPASSVTAPVNFGAIGLYDQNLTLQQQLQQAQLAQLMHFNPAMNTLNYNPLFGGFPGLQNPLQSPFQELQQQQQQNFLLNQYLQQQAQTFNPMMGAGLQQANTFQLPNTATQAAFPVINTPPTAIAQNLSPPSTSGSLPAAPFGGHTTTTTTSPFLSHQTAAPMQQPNHHHHHHNAMNRSNRMHSMPSSNSNFLFGGYGGGGYHNHNNQNQQVQAFLESIMVGLAGNSGRQSFASMDNQSLGGGGGVVSHMSTEEYEEQKKEEEYYFKLDQEIYKLQNKIKMKLLSIESERQSVLKRIEAQVREIYSECLNAKVEMYGSMATGLAIDSSDMDLLVSNVFPQSNNLTSKVVDRHILIEQMKRLYRELTNIDSSSNETRVLKECLENVQIIETASVPVIKLVIDLQKIRDIDQAGQISRNSQIIEDDMRLLKIDITFNDVQVDLSAIDPFLYGSFSSNLHMGLRCCQFIKQKLQEYPMLDSLTLVLKKFLALRNLNSPYMGGLNSYGLIILIVALFNQRDPAEFINKEGQPSASRSLKKFLQYFGNEFNPVFQMINDQQFIMDHMNYSSLLIIQDPLNPLNNIGKSTFNFDTIKQEFSRAHDKIVDSLIEYKTAAIAVAESTPENNSGILSENEEAPQKIVWKKKLDVLSKIIAVEYPFSSNQQQSSSERQQDDQNATTAISEKPQE